MYRHFAFIIVVFNASALCAIDKFLMVEDDVSKVIGITLATWLIVSDFVIFSTIRSDFREVGDE